MRIFRRFPKIPLTAQAKMTAKVLAKVLVTLLLFIFLFTQLDWEDVRGSLVGADMALLSVSFVILSLRCPFGAWRWQALLAAKNHSMPIPLLTKYYFIGMFFNFFFPTVVGGDLVRGYYLHKEGVSKKVAVSSMIVERVLGVVSLVCLSVFSLAGSFSLFRNTPLGGIILVVVGTFTGAFFLLFSLKAESFVKRIFPKTLLHVVELGVRLLQDIRDYRKAPRVLGSGLLASLLIQVLGIYATYLMGVSLGCTVRLIYYFTLLPIVWLMSMIPVSLNGLGEIGRAHV